MSFAVSSFGSHNHDVFGQWNNCGSDLSKPRSSLDDVFGHMGPHHSWSDVQDPLAITTWLPQRQGMRAPRRASTCFKVVSMHRLAVFMNCSHEACCARRQLSSSDGSKGLLP
nr:hypothetical protein CFP56_43917 [Quercus suber]